MNEHDSNGLDSMDILEIDSDNDGITDTFGIDTDHDGVVDTFGMDMDGDDELDSIGIDTDGDSEPDTFITGSENMDMFDSDGTDEPGNGSIEAEQGPSFGGYYNADGTYHWESDGSNTDEKGNILYYS